MLHGLKKIVRLLAFAFPEFQRFDYSLDLRQTPFHFRLKLRSWLDVQNLARVPARWSVFREIAADANLKQSALPSVCQDSCINQPQPSFRIKEHAGVPIGERRRVCHRKTLAPLALALAKARPFNFDVVRFALARSMKPANQQIPVRSLDNARGMIMPGFEREYQLRVAKWFFGSSKRNNPTNE